MRRKYRKGLIVGLSLVLSAFIGVGVTIGQNVVTIAEDDATIAPVTEVIENEGVKVTLTPQKDETKVSFDYWDYIDVNELFENNLLSMRMTPKDVATAEADSVIITLKDVVNPSQCIAIVINVSNGWYGTYGTYGRVALTDSLSSDTASVKIAGTEQRVKGKTELVYGSEDKYTNVGALDVGVWGSQCGFFSADTVAENAASRLNSLIVEYADYVVKAGAATYTKTGELVMRTLADLNSDAYLAASVDALSDAEEQKNYKDLYTHENVENLFSSGKATLSFTFGGVKTDSVSFLLEKVGGEAVTDAEDHTPPIVSPNITTNALKGFAYMLPNVDIFENSDEVITSYALKVKAPDGEDVAVRDNTFLAEQSGTYRLIYTIKDSKQNTAEYVYDIISYAYLPDVEFIAVSAIVPNEHYVVRNEAVIPVVQAFSDISRADNGRLKTSVVLYKDDKSVKTFDDASQEHIFALTESGEYEVVYNAENEYGICISKVLYTFTVTEQPIILTDTAEYYCQYGGEFTIPSTFCYYQGAKYPATAVCYDPNGNVVKDNGALKLSSFGTYTVVYSYEIDGIKAEASISVHSADTAEEMFACDSIGYVTENNYALPLWAKDAGVKGMFFGANSETEFSYKNEIDLSTLNKNTPLVSLLPYNDADVLYGKFSMQITLSDANDASRKIVITVQPHSGMYQYAYAHVNYDGRTLAYNTENNKISSSSMFGCLIQASLGCGYGKTNIPQFKLAYEPTEKAIYIHTNFASDPWKLLDLDDASHVGAGNEWSGFSSDKVRLSIKFYSLSSVKAGAIITEIAGQSLSGEVLTDSEKPNVYFDYSDTFAVNGARLPVAEVGKDYPLLQATAYDLVDGACEVRYGLFYENEAENLYRGANHVFDRAGIYRYIISASDKSGNESIYSYEIEAKTNVENIRITLGEYVSDNLLAGTWFVLPEINVSGGSGKVIISKSVSLNGETLDVNGLNEVFLTASGKLVVSVTVKDYLGTTIDGDSSFTLDIAPSEKPVLSNISVPNYAVSGQAVVFNDFSALIFNADGTSKNSAYRAILVDGEPVYESLNGTITGTLSYQPIKTEGTLNVKFVAGKSATEIATEQSFEIKIASLQYVSDLLQAYDYDASCNGAEVSVSRKTTGSHYVLTGNKGFSLLNAATADGFIFKLGGTAEGYNNQEIKVILTDYRDARTSVSFVLKMIGNSGYMQLNDKLVLLSGVMNDVDALFFFEYDDKTKGFLDSNGNLLTTIEKTDRGTAFNGFKSGAMTVRLEISTPNGDGCEMVVLSLGNTTFTPSLAGDKTETTYTDLVGPSIGFLGDIGSNVYALNTVVNIPQAVAFDMVTGQVVVTVKVKETSANTLAGFDNVVLTEDKQITLSNYGTYVVTYTAKDANGRSSSRSFIWKVMDTVAPTIVVEGQVPETMKVGDSLVAPRFTVTDNNSDVTKYVFLYCPNGSVVDMTQKSDYKLSATGVYKLQIYCYDADGNISQIVYKINVK